ncbi:MAG: DUF6580 family putative transport protein [Candidatus Hadarchaeales archaeon]
MFKKEDTKNTEKILSIRIKIFVILGLILAAASKFLYISRLVPFPNFELIIPTLVVIGSFSLPCGSSKSWRLVTRYFGVFALLGVFLTDLAIWGALPIYAFTWSGFLMCWLIGLRNRLSLFDRFKKLFWRTTLTAAIAILIFDVWTAFGSWLGWGEKSLLGLAAIYLAQIPFTFYHLASLVFIPPLVGLGKLMVKIKIPALTAISVRAKTSQEVKK